jgi:YGGT family.
MSIAPFVLTVLIWLINGLLLAIFASVILSWLFAFDVVSPYNRTVARISEFLDAFIGPLMIPVRSVIPPLGGLDISPMIVMFALILAKNGLAQALIHLS